ncbi:MAG: hypothetical protein EOP05_00695 [Proteobacteria bacterium]|nr:MAG: hypothetical protein EOP05_00695 [Pseudomonadota bacterium]
MPISFSDVSFVIQGPVFRNIDGEDLTLKALNSIKRFCPGAEIILSTWRGQNTDGLPFDQLVVSEDPGAFKDRNGEPINMNRQLISTQAGIAKVKRLYAVKFRADFLLSDCNFIKELPPTPESPDAFFKRKIRMTNLFVQNPQKMPFLFHLSDLIQFGLSEDIKNFWNIPLYVREEILNLDSSRETEFGTYLGGSDLRLRNEQALPIGFLNKVGRGFRFENPNQMTLEMFGFFEKFLTSNFDVIDWNESGLIFPKRMMDSFLETVFTRDELLEIESTPEKSEARFQKAIFNKRYKSLFNRAYLFHLKKEIVFRYPSTVKFFSGIKRWQRLFFGKKLRQAETARALLANRQKDLR